MRSEKLLSDCQHFDFLESLCNKKNDKRTFVATARCWLNSALVLPIILLTFASIIEVSRVLLLQHTADTAAYEGARGGMVPGATATDAANASQALLDAAGLRSTEVVVSPTTITDETSLITVQVSIPVSNIFGSVQCSSRTTSFAVK